MTTEEKVIQKVVDLLSANATINGYVSSRVYASHISSIAKPTFPCLSVHLALSKSEFSPYGIVNVTLQIDTWLPASQNNMNDVLNIHEAIRSELYREVLSDTTLGLIVMQSNEINGGPLLYEEDEDLFHYPVIYFMVAK
jgi:hypothetical protein